MNLDNLNQKTNQIGYEPEPGFSLRQFSNLNLERCDCPFQCKDKDITYWTIALSEEVGEIAGAVKKLLRGFNEREKLKMVKKFRNDFPDKEVPSDDTLSTMWYLAKLKAVSEEAADLFIYLDLLAQKCNFSLWANVKDKFNSVSEEMGLGEEYKIK